MKYRYKTQGTCSTEIILELEDNKLKSVEFIGGCNGNLQGICKLVTGMDADEVVEKLQGIRCGWKDTSCPDQLAQAIDKALGNE